MDRPGMARIFDRHARHPIHRPSGLPRRRRRPVARSHRSGPTVRAGHPVAGAALHDGEYWPEDPSRTRLFFGPTGRMLRRNEIQFTDAYILFPSLQGGVATFGGENGSVTTGAGFGFDGNSTSRAILMLGGSRRVTRNVAIISENYLLTENDNGALVSAGFRFMGEKISVDFAGFTASNSEVPIIPYLAFIYKF